MLKDSRFSCSFRFLAVFSLPGCMAGIALFSVLELCCASARGRTTKTEGRGEGEGLAVESVDLASSNRDGLVANVSSMVGNLAGTGDASSRVRDTIQRELAVEHPEMPPGTLKTAWEEAGVVSGEQARQAETSINQGRAGRYKKKP